MKSSSPWTLSILTACGLAVALTGCSTVPDDYQDPEGLSYMKADHGLQVSQTPGADLASYDVVWVAPTQSTATPPDKPEEVAQFERLKSLLQTEFLKSLHNEGVFKTVVMEPEAVPPGSRALKLESNIVRYEPGSAGLRFTVGFGAGWPTIMSRVTLSSYPDAQPVLHVLANRGFEARPFEYSDEAILNGNVEDLANDVSNIIKRLVRGKSIK